jgi:hypothetical protein
MKKILEQTLGLPVCFDLLRLIQHEMKSHGAPSKSFHHILSGTKEIKQGDGVFMRMSVMHSSMLQRGIISELQSMTTSFF